VSNPYGNDPYGQQPPNPYGAGGGSSFNAPGAGGFQQPKTDGVSIAAFVLSLLCCSPVALVLGIVGIVRTKGGQRKGRWAAIVGLVLSIIGLIGGVALIAAGGLFLSSIVELDEAEVGQCVKIDEDDDTVLLREAECNEEHDGEIVYTATVTEENNEDISALMGSFCAAEVAKGPDADKLLDYLDDIQAVIEDPNDVEVGDHLVCYVDKKLDKPIL